MDETENGLEVLDVPLKDVVAGDWAWHVDGLDPRMVTRVEVGGVWLNILGEEMGPFPADNYDFTRLEIRQRGKNGTD